MCVNEYSIQLNDGEMDGDGQRREKCLFRTAHVAGAETRKWAGSRLRVARGLEGQLWPNQAGTGALMDALERGRVCAHSLTHPRAG